MLYQDLKSWIPANLFNSKNKLISKRTTECWFKSKNVSYIRDMIIDKTSFLVGDVRFGARVHCILNDITENPKCIHCKTNDVGLGFKNVEAGYTFSEFCSIQCINKSDQTKRKIKDTNLKLYGVDHYFKSEDGQRAKKNACVEKYGVENVFQSDVIKERYKNNLLTEYGVENISQIPEVKEKKKLKSLDKYGTDWVVQSDEFKSKSKQTNLTNKGVENPQQCQIIKIQTQQTRRRIEYHKYKSSKLFTDVVEFLFDESEYINGKNINLDCRCNSCNNIFGWNKYNDGRIPRCPVCFPKQKFVSFAETTLAKFIESLHLDLVLNSRKILPSRKELDIFIPKYNIAIEFNGLYWHSDKAKGATSRHFLNKTEQCEKLGIHLIHIFEDEWKYKLEIIKSKIRKLLGQTDTIIDKFDINPISQQIAFEFLEVNSLYGSPIHSNLNLGIFIDNKLVGISIINENNEIIELCEMVGVSIKNFRNEIIQYCKGTLKLISLSMLLDRRWHTTNDINSEYEITNPKFYYISNEIRDIQGNGEIFLNKKKNKLWDDNLTEWENMQLNNIDRVWDCGLIKVKLI